MAELLDYPLVTFALFTYNQEEYIGEAIEAALAQDYPNLEIIISDDCSRDNTYAVAKSMVAGRQGRLILRRNDRNVGVAAHINQIMSIARGELIVAAAGDDISEPDRCSSIVSAWLSAAKQPDSICSSVVLIDRDGTRLGEAACDERAAASGDFFSGRRWLIGSSHAWTRRTFEFFGELPDWLLAEDKVIGFRSSLLGGVLHVNRPLVRYRCHSGSISSKNSILQKTHQSLLNMRGHRRDLGAVASGSGGVRGLIKLAEIQYTLDKEIGRAEARAGLYADPTISGRFMHVIRRWKELSARDVLRAFGWP